MCERVSHHPTPAPVPFSPCSLLQNYKVYCTLHNIPIDETIAQDATAEDANTAGRDMDMDLDDEPHKDNAGDGDGEEWAGIGDDDQAEEDEGEELPAFFKEMQDAETAKEAAKTPSRNPKSRVALVVRAKVTKVLNSTGLADKRARQCDQNDFLKLLLGMFFFFF